MEQEKILMGQKQLQRWHLMKMVEVGKITLKEAGERIGLSYRQGKRIGRAIRERGMKGLVHCNRGRPSNHRIEKSLRKKVLELSKEVYWDFNDTHFTEKLRECEGIDLKRETVRKLRREAGMAPQRRRRGPKHRKRRERKAQEGGVGLWDGSPHPWFGPDRPPCCLMAAIDDATGKLLAARFFPFEGSAGYLWLLKEMVKKYGIPMVIFQDRLGVELRLKGIVTMEEANRFLQSTFLNAFNRRFAVKPRESQKAWREVSKHLDLDRIISFRYTATVGNDNTARLGGVVLDIPPGPQKRSYAKPKEEAPQLLGGPARN